MNRFFDIPSIPSREMLPWESRKWAYPTTTGIFILEEPLRFRSEIAGGVIVIPVGFESDLASIPGSAEWFMSCDDQRIAGGAWVHDYLYRHGGMIRLEGLRGITELKREECDRILCFEAMPELGATTFQQRAVFAALRLFGASSFQD